MRIGILQTDSVREEFQDAFGDYPGMFRSLLSQAAAEAARPVEFAVYDVERGHYPAGVDACDGYVITGSRESVYADLPWIARLSDYVRTLHEARRKTVGVCFGHQLIAHALGGETRAADAGWGVGVHQVRIVGQAPWMQPARRAVSLLSSHKDQVVRAPPGARLLGSNDFCPIGFLRPRRPPADVPGPSRVQQGLCARPDGVSREAAGRRVRARGRLAVTSHRRGRGRPLDAQFPDVAAPLRSPGQVRCVRSGRDAA